jgi:hypothetical protein
MCRDRNFDNVSHGMVRIQIRRWWLLATAIVVSLVVVVFVISATFAAGVKVASPRVGSITTPSAPADSRAGTIVPPSSSNPAEQPLPAANVAPGSTETTLTNEAPSTIFTSLLEQLPVDANPLAHSGYNRDYFNAWIDADSNGCNTRAEVLLAESTTTVTTRSTCTVSTGTWFSSYDGLWILDAGKLDIDHFVPLKEAWVSGAYAWDTQTQTQFGNDLGYAASLLAVSASSNRSKSDRDPASWMPANAAFACDYVATWVGVKYRWGLSVDLVEKRVLESVLSGCRVVTVSAPEQAPVTLAPSPPSDAPVAISGNGSRDGDTDPDFATCKAATAAGRGPYLQGVDVEYGYYRDGDKDGMVCE